MLTVIRIVVWQTFEFKFKKTKMITYRYVKWTCIKELADLEFLLYNLKQRVVHFAARFNRVRSKTKFQIFNSELAPSRLSKFAARTETFRLLNISVPGELHYCTNSTSMLQGCAPRWNLSDLSISREQTIIVVSFLVSRREIVIRWIRKIWKTM